MLRGTREKISFLASISNCAGVIALCFLLLATAVVVSPQANLSSLSHSAFAQEAGEQARDNTDALSTLKTVVQLAEVKDTEGLEEIAAVNDTEQLAEMTGSSDSEELVETPGITSSEAVESIVEVPDLEGLADLVGVSPDELPDTVLPEPPTTEQPPTTDEPATDDGGTTDEPATDDGGTTDEPATDDGGTTDDNGTGTDEPATDDGGTTDDNGTGTDEPATDDGGVDKWGVDEIYPTTSNGPTWYIREQEDPTADGHFYYGMYKTTTINYKGSGVWHVDAESGTQEHGIRMHVDSPTGKWKNTEITGYFNVQTGDDQITMIARHGPSYHDDGGCLAYGYYGMTAVDGNVFFKKKLYHFDGGYTKRLAQVDALDNIKGNWLGMKFVVYDLPNGDVKLELWVDQGDMTNNWKKVSELVDEGNLAVEGGDDCGRQSTDKIEDGTRVSYRADNSAFDFKKLSVREINAS